MRGLYPHGSIIPNLICTVCKNRFNYLLFNLWLKFYKTTWLEIIISQENFVIAYDSIIQLLPWLQWESKSTTLSPNSQAPIVSRFKKSFYHLTGAFLPHGDHIPIYVQIYILNIVEQLNVKRLNNRNLDPVVMNNLQTILLDSHLYISHYHYIYELIREKLVEEQEKITIRLHVNLQ